MKKFLILILSLLLLSACAGEKDGDDDAEVSKPKEHYDVVFLSDLGFIYDNGVNERCLYGIKNYCEENELKYTFLQPAGSDEVSMDETFDQAINRMSPSVVVAAGLGWDTYLAKKMADYPELKAIYVDGKGKYENGEAFSHPENMAVICFAEAEAAYMAGYAVIKDGYRKLGWISENNEAPIDNIAFGFVRGICDALAETETEEETEAAEEKEEDAAELIYAYTDGMEESPAEKVSKWYADGTEIIFVCGDDITEELIPVARESGSGKLIGWRYDEYLRRALDGEDYEPLFITSTVNNLEQTVYSAIKAAYAGGSEWRLYCGSDVFTAGIKENGVSLAPYRSVNWRRFTKTDYEALKEKVSSGINVPSQDASENTESQLTIISSE